jgi:ABC-type bacteriocin/lantibiotic exporter with double-glycine peptidase domain
MKKYQELFLEKFNFKPKVILDFPDLRQISNFDCGVTCLQQILIYYGIEKREDELIKLLDSKRTSIIEHGTKLSKIKEVTEYYGLECEILKNSSIKKLKQLIDEGIPAILLLQAWRDFSVDNLDWEEDYSDGHYVVGIGYNDNCIFFEDPSAVVRTYLTYEELDKRWHDVDDDNKTKNSHVMIVIRGEKKFNSEEIIHMD